MDFTVGIVSRNLATRSNSETVEISRFSGHQEGCGTLGTFWVAQEVPNVKCWISQT